MPTNRLVLLLLLLAGCSSAPARTPPGEFADDLPAKTYRDAGSPAGSPVAEVCLVPDGVETWHGPLWAAASVEAPESAAAGAKVVIQARAETTPATTRVRAALFAVTPTTDPERDGVFTGPPLAEVDAVQDPATKGWTASFEQPLEPGLVVKDEKTGEAVEWNVSFLFTDKDGCVERRVYAAMTRVGR